MAKYRVLSIDGGGIRGIVTTVMMQRLAATPGLEGFLDKVDLIAGTSTGGLLALAIGRGLGLEEIRNLYIDDGPEIFDDSWIDDLLDLGKLRGADYKTAPMRRVFKRVLGENTTLGQLEKHVLITAFDLDNVHPKKRKRTWKPKLFHNFKGPRNDRSELVYKVGLYTAAAPTYFPTVDGYVDGGVYATNPSMCALAQTQDERYLDPPVEMKDVVLLSLGTGTSLFHIKGKNLNWGYAQWIKPLISLMLDGVSGIADYQCAQMLRDRYHRLAPVFPPDVSIPMDGVKKIPYMIDFANGLRLSKTTAWMRDHWMTS
ncbi:MAG: patatin-like phospholipase family protein [Acidobacteriota bacterium]|nr:patatin-like phospholipase family protein [Acidobacteriota bacterium]